MPDLAWLGNFHLLRPWWLLGLLPALVWLVVWWRIGSPEARWRGIIAPHLLRHLLLGAGAARRFNPPAAALLLNVLLVVALCGPSWERRASPFAHDEALLVIALDASASMNERDVQPTRLARARQKISDLLRLRPGAPTALVVYAGSAHAVIPLSSDEAVVRNFLGAVDSAIMPRPGKRLAKVMPLFEELLGDSTRPATLLVLSDAVSAPDIAALGAYFAGGTHQLLVLGIGAPGKGNAGSFDANSLQELAARGGGHYQALSLDDSDMRRIARRIEQHLVSGEQRMRPWVDAGYLLCLPIALLFLLWFRRGWTLQWCLLAVVLGALAQPSTALAGPRFADLWLTPDQQGRYYFEKGDFATAAARFRDPAWKAAALYMAEDFTRAAELFADMDSTDALFSLGNALAHDRHYLLAMKAWQRVLEREPAHEGAARNRALVQSIIDETMALSESQQPEPGEQSEELGDQPQTAEGAEKKDFGPREITQYSAEQILADPALNELWMRQVQPDPARFLRVKFQMQLQQAEGAGNAR